MAAKTGATFVKRLQDAIAKLGTNGTKIPDGNPPDDIKGNEAISQWHDKQRAVAEFLIASTVKKAAEAREKKAREMVDGLILASEAFAVGDNKQFVFDNVSLGVKVNNPQRRIDRSLLLVALAKEGINAQKIEAIISAAEADSKPPRVLSASTTVE